MMRSRSGFTIVELLVTAFVAMCAVMGCWAIYETGNRFYDEALHQMNVQRYARVAADAMLYGYNGAGLLQATGIPAVNDTDDVTTISYNGRVLTWDKAKKQLLYTENLDSPLAITPEYVQNDGGIAFFYQNVPAVANDTITINFEVVALTPGTDPDNYQDSDLKGFAEMSVKATGRMIP